jgi:hypothetical protein
VKSNHLRFDQMEQFISANQRIGYRLFAPQFGPRQDFYDGILQEI